MFRIKSFFETRKIRKEFNKFLLDTKEASVKMGMGCRYSFYADGDLNSISFSAKPAKNKEELCVLLEELVRSLRSQDFTQVYPSDSNRVDEGDSGVCYPMHNESTRIVGRKIVKQVKQKPVSSARISTDDSSYSSSTNLYSDSYSSSCDSSSSSSSGGCD